ncbi:MAG: hypothetical protein J1E40_01400 [Oscillospiraceae bacterium]|nr:hypothetical protein [Oscillospiraceae bacterium]
MENQELCTLFEDVMDEGIQLSDDLIELETTKKAYPDYLKAEKHIVLSPDSKVNPAKLEANCAYIYHDSLYLTDEDGNIAYIDCELILTPNTKEIKEKHPEYKSVGGKNALHDDMDAGHFGVQLGQHPSIAMEQHRYLNRWGSWRSYELSWVDLLKEGHNVNLKAVFTKSEEGTYSDFWCVRETIDNDDYSEFILTNDEWQ